jgi:hypothetical protein
MLLLRRENVATNSANNPRIPVIYLDPPGVPSVIIFNQNEWVSEGKAIVQSCASAYSVILHVVDRIGLMCFSPEEQCWPHFSTLEEQW